MVETSNFGAIEQLKDHLAQAQGGNETALNDFFRQIEPGLWSYALKRTGNYDDAAELVADTEIKIWKSLGTLDPERNLIGWCLTAERNRWIDILRSQRSRPQPTYLPENEDMVDMTEMSAFADTGASPEDLVLLAESHNQLIEALNRLSPSQREAIYLVYFKDYTHPQAAELTQTPLGTTKTRLRLGLQHLKETYTTTPSQP